MDSINTSDTLTTLELRRLIHELWDRSPGTKIRFRTIGKMWDKNFSQIVHVTASSAMIVQDRDNMRHVSINDVVEFELDSKFREYKPNYHYTVKFP